MSLKILEGSKRKERACVGHGVDTLSSQWWWTLGSRGALASRRRPGLSISYLDATRKGVAVQLRHKRHFWRVRRPWRNCGACSQLGGTETAKKEESTGKGGGETNEHRVLDARESGLTRYSVRRRPGGPRSVCSWALQNGRWPPADRTEVPDIKWI